MTRSAFSGLERLLAVLDLFDERTPAFTAEAIADGIGVSLPTGYRYVRLLVDAGLLQKVEASRYALGPRIVVLDYYIRQGDPLLREAAPPMRELVAKTGFDCVLTTLNGAMAVDVHREYGRAPALLAYGRGRPRPLLRGAAPKVVLASLPAARLRKVFQAQAGAVAAAGLPTDWTAFRSRFAQIRRRGWYLSEGELEPTLAAIAAPVPKEDGAWGAISLVIERQRLEILDVERMAELLRQAAGRIAERLADPVPVNPSEIPEDSP